MSKSSIEHDVLTLKMKLDSFERSLKSQLESSMKSTMKLLLDQFTNQIDMKLDTLIDKKYSNIHNRNYISNKDVVVLSKEDVLRAVELVVSDDNIKDYSDKYMTELSLIRFFYNKNNFTIV